MAHPGSSDESGMVTVETALGLGSLMFVLAFALAAIGTAHSRGVLCEQVRVAARSVSMGAAAPAGFDVEPLESGFTISTRGPAVTVGPWDAGSVSCSVTVPVDPFPWIQLSAQ